MSCVSDLIILNPSWRHESVMRSFVGTTIYTLHTGIKLEYTIVGVTEQNVEELKVHKESMYDYYVRKHRLGLRCQFLKAFECCPSAQIPPELCFCEADPSVRRCDDLQKI